MLKSRNKATRTDFRLQIFNKTGGKCAYCGCRLSETSFHVDHIIPSRKSNPQLGIPSRGSDCIENLLPSCDSCNCSKSDYSVENFRHFIKNRVERLNSFSSEYRIAKRFGLVEEKNIEIQFYFETLTHG